MEEAVREVWEDIEAEVCALSCVMGVQVSNHYLDAVAESMEAYRVDFTLNGAH